MRGVPLLHIFKDNEPHDGQIVQTVHLQPPPQQQPHIPETIQGISYGHRKKYLRVRGP
jgi:hypothetical protein